MSDESKEVSAAIRMGVVFCAAYALIGGGVTLVGWFAGLPRLTDWLDSGISMFANAALAACCSALALLLARSGSARARLAAAMLGGGVAMLGSLTLLEHLTGADFGIDTLLIEPAWGAKAAMSPGRMGPPASTSFALLGMALVLIARGSSRARRAAPALGIAVCLIAGLSLMGYAFGADPLFAVARFTGIAMQTGTVLLVLALGVIASVPEAEPMRALQEKSAAGMLIRRSLPFIVGLPVALGLLLVRAQEAGWFDTAMGASLVMLALIAVFSGLLWRWAAAVGRHERALRESERSESIRRTELEALMRAAPAAIWIGHDAGCSRITGNPAACAIQRMSLGANMSVTPAEGDAPAHFEVHRNREKLAPDQLPMQTAARTGQMVENQELEFRFADGSSTWVFGNAVPLFGRGGEVRGVVGTFVDITERKRAEEQLREAKEKLMLHAAELKATVAERTAKLQETVNELQSFSYSIAHDMRAPLRAMGTFAQLLKEEFCSISASAEAKDYCERIVTGAARLDNLINDALNYTKASLQEFPLREVDVSALLKGLVETYPNLRAQTATIQIDPGLPIVLGNEALLTQCFSNLLGNAVKFVAPGVRPAVRVWSESREGLARIWVEDNGIGIPALARPRLFVMFQKLDNEYEGTGIGLAIVRKAVERMSGRVGVDSEPGRGSRFWVELRPALSKEGI